MITDFGSAVDDYRGSRLGRRERRRCRSIAGLNMRVFAPEVDLEGFFFPLVWSLPAATCVSGLMFRAPGMPASGCFPTMRRGGLPRPGCGATSPFSSPGLRTARKAGEAPGCLVTFGSGAGPRSG
jgi:hypothetical protein